MDNIPRCKGKICYDKKGAVTSKNLRFKKEHVVLRIYNCPICKMWHLTSLVDQEDYYGTFTRSKFNRKRFKR